MRPIDGFSMPMVTNPPLGPVEATSPWLPPDKTRNNLGKETLETSTNKREKSMPRKTTLIIFLLTVAFFCLHFQNAPLADEVRLRLATTTSTENTGLLPALNPPFEKMMGIAIDVIPVGTGKALKMGATGDVDVVMVHARSAEEKFVQEGHGVNRRDVMYNDFVIIGPKNDPAGIKGLSNAKVALKRIAETPAVFVSRGDESGTHKKEVKIWEEAGIKPEGRWYLEAGQGMGSVLNMANEKQAYTLSDRGTYLALSGKVDLEVLCEGDPELMNPYGIIAVNPERFPHVQYVYALAYIGWVTSPEGQKIIREFGKDTFGRPLFIPTAVP
jgi:tungstate transport system substrate-binding protein